MTEKTATDSGDSRRYLVENAARLSLKNRVLERLLGLFRSGAEKSRLKDELLEAAVDAVPSEAASLFLRNGKRELVVVAARGRVAEKIKGLKLKPRQGLAGAALADGRSLAVSDVARDGRHAAEVAAGLGFDVRSLLAVPVLRGTEPIGVIELINKNLNDEFHRHEIELVERVARTAGDLLKPLR